MRTLLALLPVVCLALLLAPPSRGDDAAEEERVEPQVVLVDHILIGVEGHPRMKTGDPLEVARGKAYDIVAKLKAGGDWDALKKAHTDDGPPSRPPGGPYVLSNTSVQQQIRGVVPRARMVKGFGDKAFALEVGEVGVADYDKEDSPFGFHVMKRLDLGPDYVTVDHILIGVKGPRMPQGDTDEVARKKVYDLLAQLEKGADWATLKSEHSDDPPPGGPYTMANHGQMPRGAKEYPRSGMAPAFGDVGFALDVDAMKIADYDAQKSPFGYHLIKRIK